MSTVFIECEKVTAKKEFVTFQKEFSNAYDLVVNITNELGNDAEFGHDYDAERMRHVLRVRFFVGSEFEDTVRGWCKKNGFEITDFNEHDGLCGDIED